VLLHTQQTDAVLNNANKKDDRQNPNLWPERQGRGHYNRQSSAGRHRRRSPQVSPMPLSRTVASSEKPHIVDARSEQKGRISALDLARAAELSKLNRKKKRKEKETIAHKRLVRNTSYPIHNFNLGHFDDTSRYQKIPPMSAQLDQNSVSTQLSIDSNDSQWAHLLWVKQQEEEMEIFHSISLQLEARLQEARAVLPKLEVFPSCFVVKV
jgi:hypothetical protein